MAYTRWNESEIEVKKHNKYSDEYESTASAIATLAEEIWHECYTPIIGTAQVDYMLAKFQSAEQFYKDIKSNDFMYLTAKNIKHDRLVGYSACQPKDNYLLLSKMFVHKNYRRKGIFQSFLEEILAICRWECGFDKIRLLVNKHNDIAIAVYQKAGFETVNSIKTAIGEGFFMDDLVMEMPVKQVMTE